MILQLLTNCSLTGKHKSKQYRGKGRSEIRITDWMMAITGDKPRTRSNKRPKIQTLMDFGSTLFSAGSISEFPHFLLKDLKSLANNPCFLTVY